MARWVSGTVCDSVIRIGLNGSRWTTCCLQTCPNSPFTLPVTTAAPPVQILVARITEAVESLDGFFPSRPSWQRNQICAFMSTHLLFGARPIMLTRRSIDPKGRLLFDGGTRFGCNHNFSQSLQGDWALQQQSEAFWIQPPDTASDACGPLLDTGVAGLTLILTAFSW